MTDKEQHPPFVTPKVAKSLEELSKSGHKVQVVGHVKDGKVVLDASSLAELNKKFPSANLSFVAVNAPFKACRV
jgi:thiol-disulfide isomerase/thioredoxin